MKLDAVWTQELPEQIPQKDKESVENLLEMLDFCDENEIKNYLDEDALYENNEFCDWIYSKTDRDMNDMKRELMKKTSRYTHLTQEQQKEYLQTIGKPEENKRFGVDFREEEFYAASKMKLYQIARRYLKKEKRSDFVQDISFCFPDIYFDTSVDASMHTLNRRFEDIREEIVEHLTALDSYRKQFLKSTKENRGYREIADAFQEYSKIDCSPQANRKNVKELKREFENTISHTVESVNCELHTKFNKFNTDRTKQDRIYFAPAKEGIQDGKVIVIHIGKHL
nr:hypothetical protein [uncultured Blautia sp.]